MAYLELSKSAKFFDYTELSHGFFPELVRLVISLSSVGIAFELQKTGRAQAYDATTLMTIQGNQLVRGVQISFFPYRLYEILLAPGNRQPKVLTVIKAPIPDIAPEHPITVTKVQELMTRLVGEAFLSYYERHLDAIEKLAGKESAGRWPPAWGFGWAIRNACAHDGRILFKRQDHAPVQWRSLTYSYVDNGRQVLFKDMTGVELILLMEDMDAFLKSNTAAIAASNFAYLSWLSGEQG